MMQLWYVVKRYGYGSANSLEMYNSNKYSLVYKAPTVTNVPQSTSAETRLLHCHLQFLWLIVLFDEVLCQWENLLSIARGAILSRRLRGFGVHLGANAMVGRASCVPVLCVCVECKGRRSNKLLTHWLSISYSWVGLVSTRRKTVQWTFPGQI